MPPFCWIYQARRLLPYLNCCSTGMSNTPSMLWRVTRVLSCCSLNATRMLAGFQPKTLEWSGGRRESAWPFHAFAKHRGSRSGLSTLGLHMPYSTWDPIQLLGTTKLLSVSPRRTRPMLTVLSGTMPFSMIIASRSGLGLATSSCWNVIAICWVSSGTLGGNRSLRQPQPGVRWPKRTVTPTNKHSLPLYS